MKKVLQTKDHDNILYQHCQPEWRTVIDNNRENLIVKKGDVILKEGDPVKGVFFITHGKVKVHQNWTGQKEWIIRFAKDGDMVGHRGLGREKSYPVTATALEHTSLFHIAIDVFEATLQVNPKFTYALMNFYANELEDSEKRVRNMAHRDVKSRIAELLLQLKNKFGINNHGFIDIKLTRQEIASYTGTTYESASRMISELEHEQYIQTSGKNIKILKEKLLHKVINN